MDSTQPDDDRRQRTDPPSWRPVPDPTELTTIALYREVSALEAVIVEKIAAQEAVVAQKFANVDSQLKLIEAQRQELKGDQKIALDAALTAVKDQLKEMSNTFTIATSGLATIVEDVKQRVITMEALKLGATQQREGVSSSVQLMATIIAIFIGIITIVGAIVAVNGGK